MIAVLAGGVGAARFLRGLVAVADPEEVTAVVNTGDDTVLHGLTICPDLDTVTYTLAEAIDPERGWGLVGETWRALGALRRYEANRPPGSRAGATWFGLGDQDLATHLYRTGRLAEGASLTEVTAEIGRAWGVAVRLLPMTDERAPTTIETTDGRILTFQEYFVGERHAVPVRSVHLGGRGVPPTAAVLDALRVAHTIVIAPSNPLVSIGPIRALDGIDEILASRREHVVAISPIIAGAALKGPADRMLAELGHEPSVVGVAEMYAAVCSTLVIDGADAALATAVERTGVRCVVTDTVMTTPRVAADLARTALGAVV